MRTLIFFLLLNICYSGTGNAGEPFAIKHGKRHVQATEELETTCYNAQRVLSIVELYKSSGKIFAEAAEIDMADAVKGLQRFNPFTGANASTMDKIFLMCDLIIQAAQVQTLEDSVALAWAINAESEKKHDKKIRAVEKLIGLNKMYLRLSKLEGDAKVDAWLNRSNHIQFWDMVNLDGDKMNIDFGGHQARREKSERMAKNSENIQAIERSIFSCPEGEVAGFRADTSGSSNKIIGRHGRKISRSKVSRIQKDIEKYQETSDTDIFIIKQGLKALSSMIFSLSLGNDGEMSAVRKIFEKWTRLIAWVSFPISYSPAGASPDTLKMASAGRTSSSARNESSASNRGARFVAIPVSDREYTPKEKKTAIEEAVAAEKIYFDKQNRKLEIKFQSGTADYKLQHHKCMSRKSCKISDWGAYSVFARTRKKSGDPVMTSMSGDPHANPEESAKCVYACDISGKKNEVLLYSDGEALKVRKDEMSVEEIAEKGKSQVLLNTSTIASRKRERNNIIKKCRANEASRRFAELAATRMGMELGVSAYEGEGGVDKYKNCKKVTARAIKSIYKKTHLVDEELDFLRDTEIKTLEEWLDHYNERWIESVDNSWAENSSNFLASGWAAVGLGSSVEPTEDSINQQCYNDPNCKQGPGFYEVPDVNVNSRNRAAYNFLGARLRRLICSGEGGASFSEFYELLRSAGSFENVVKNSQKDVKRTEGVDMDPLRTNSKGRFSPEQCNQLLKDKSVLKGLFSTLIKVVEKAGHRKAKLEANLLKLQLLIGSGGGVGPKMLCKKKNSQAGGNEGLFREMSLRGQVTNAKLLQEVLKVLQAERDDRKYTEKLTLKSLENAQMARQHAQDSLARLSVRFHDALNRMEPVMGVRTNSPIRFSIDPGYGLNIIRDENKRRFNKKVRKKMLQNTP